ncbi:MAG: hypothetical protein V2I67_09525 [Thermoanaerobaculales bacterium]|jgi:hypothetical protein|nr:hypothetical protein [Thermoanaerobaculales bacterium]
MVDTLVQLSIADVTLTAVGDSRSVHIEKDSDFYAAFLGGRGDPGNAVEFVFELQTDRPPEPGVLPMVFDTGEAWKVYRDGPDTLIAMPAPRGVDGHLWVVRLNQENRHHQLYVGPALVRHEAGRRVIENPLRYPLDQILMMYLMAQHRCLILHAAGICRGGLGVLFSGVSGAGKSTLSGLLEGLDDTVHLSDDRVVARKVRDGIRVYGTPWPGEAMVAADESAPLGAVVLLRQAAHHELTRLEPVEALKRLLPMASILWYDSVRADAALGWCDELLRSVRAYELAFARDERVRAVVEDLFDELSAS